jgi:hypothetical protein
MKTRLLTLLSLPVLLATACGGDDRPEGGENQPLPPQPIEKTSALAAANANLRSVLMGSARSAVFIDDAKLVSDVLDMAGDCAEPLPGEGSSECLSFDFETSASTVADDVAAKFLNIANVETEEEKKLTLKIDPARACEGSSDVQCVQAFTDVPIRVELTTRGDNKIDLAWLVGEARAKVIDMRLYPNEVSIEVDLGAAREALVRFAIAMGQSADDLPAIMTGRVRLGVTKHAESDYSMAFAVLSALAIGGGEGDEAFLFELGVANPAATVRIDANQEQVTASSAFGVISGTMPLSSFFSDTTVGTAQFRLGALKMSSTLKAGDENVVIDNIDLGDGFSLSANNQPIVGGDVDVRRIEVSSAEDVMTVAVSPSFLANLSLDYRNLPGGAVDMPAWALDEDLTVELNGAAMPSVEFDNTSEAIKVTAGQLGIRSRATGNSVSVGAGMCLIAEDQEPMDPMMGEEPHPLEALSSGTCPTM